MPSKIKTNSASPERQQFLNLRNFPARLDASEAAWLLGFQAHDIPILVEKSFLKPLGSPTRNAQKYFSNADVLELYSDTRRLDRATRAVMDHWRSKNCRKRRNSDQCARSGATGEAMSSL